ncbi:MAG TPA: PDZ domain-containing protein [Kofleriaceae bacterium]|nr:PDZ domain-containing protein [Kofleriaceae bacterium]
MKLISIVLASALLPATALASPRSKNNQNHNGDASATSTQSVEVEAFEWSSGQGRLGLMLEGLTPQLRSYFGAPNDSGLLVAQVAPNSPAARAGVQVGDVITQVNRQTVQSADDIISATRSATSSTNNSSTSNPSSSSTSANNSNTNTSSSNTSAGMANKVQIHVIRNHQALDLQATLGSQTRSPGA